MATYKGMKDSRETSVLYHRRDLARSVWQISSNGWHSNARRGPHREIVEKGGVEKDDPWKLYT